MEKQSINRTIRYCLLWGAVLFSFSSLAGTKPVLWDMAQLKSIKSEGVECELFQECIKEADIYIDRPFLAITNKEKSFADDKHFYSSLAPYWWPDPNDPGGKYIRKDGVRNPETLKYDSSILYSLGDRLRSLGVAYYFTGESKYRDAYLAQIQVFFLSSETNMYPNLEYSQVVPGYNNNHGRSFGIIEAESFSDILDSYRLVSSTKRINRKIDKGIKRWFSDFLEWMLTSEMGKEVRSGEGNISLFYDVLALNIASFVRNSPLRRELTNKFRQNRLDEQIMDDGSQPIELARTRGYFYSIYNLQHIVDFCIIQESLGNHYYNNNKEIIDKAFYYLIQYIGNQEEFKYQQITSWEDCEIQLKKQATRLIRLGEKDDILDSFLSELKVSKISDVLY